MDQRVWTLGLPPGPNPTADTSTTKAALIDGVLDMVLATPIGVLSAQTVSYMIAACEGSGDIPDQTLLPADMFISENI